MRRLHASTPVCVTPAGLMVVDQQASPVFIAADLLSQAEHGPDSQVRLTPSSNACGLIL